MRERERERERERGGGVNEGGGKKEEEARKIEGEREREKVCTIHAHTTIMMHLPPPSLTTVFSGLPLTVVCNTSRLRLALANLARD